MREEKVLLRAVLVFPMRDGRVLLGRKLRKIGAGKLNGYGGGIEPGESARTAAVREVREECGIIVRRRDLRKAAIVTFTNRTRAGEVFDCVVHVFLAREWRGRPRGGSEMAEPRLYRTSIVPALDLLPADKHWLPPVLKGQRIVAHAWYGPHQETLLRPVRLRRVNGLPEG